MCVCVCVCVCMCVQGKPIDFIDVDEGNRQWLTDFKSKPISMPHRMETMDGEGEREGGREGGWE